MRVSISTKVILGFVLVIVALGSSSVYNLYHTDRLRENIVFLRRGAFPIKERFLRLEEKLRIYYNDVLETTRRPVGLQKARDRIPNLHPFRDLRGIGVQLSSISRQDAISEEEREHLLRLANRIEDLRSGVWLHERFPRGYKRPGGFAPDILGSDSLMSNHELIDERARAFVQAVDESQYSEAYQYLAELRRLVNEVWRSVKSLRRDFNRILASINERGETNEIRAVVTAGIITVAAILVGVLVMIVTNLAIKRIGYLSEAVRRIAKGEYNESVQVQGSDEIAVLGKEFNQMVGSLQDRDRMLAFQREDLLRSERLATIGKISAQITHEIRNPLSSIGLNAELLDDELQRFENVDILESRNLLKSIGSEVDRLTDVTEQYLRFARLPRPQLEQEDLAGLVSDLLRFVSEEMAVRNITIDSEILSIPPVMADNSQLWQALLNLLRNGSESMLEGGILRVRTFVENGEAVVSIADTGIGISTERSEEIFEPFYTTKEHGTGLGLALVHQIIGEHGGAIRYQSEPNKGTEFIVTLPVIESGPST